MSGKVVRIFPRGGASGGSPQRSPWPNANANANANGQLHRARSFGARDAFGARAAALAAAMALAILTGTLGLLGATAMGTNTPLSESAQAVAEATAAAPATPQLEVVFRSDARVEQVQAALEGIGAQVVSGPSQLGVYRIVLPASADTAAAAQLLQGERRGVAIFAQPAR